MAKSGADLGQKSHFLFLVPGFMRKTGKSSSVWLLAFREISGSNF